MTQPTKQRTVVRGVTLIDGTGARPVENAVVLIEENRIAAVGSPQTLAIPEDAVVIDGAGRFLLPGLIDLHVHMYSPQFTLVPPNGDLMAFAGVVCFNNLRSALQAGITTVRDVGNYKHIDLALKSAAERKLILAPRIFASGIGISMTGGHGSQSPEMNHEVDSPDEMRKAVREEIKAGADWIKLLSSHRSDFPELSQEEISAGVEETHRLGKKVAIHAANWVGVRMAARAGVDTIEHGSFVDEESANLMVEKGITLVPTLWVKNHVPRLLEKMVEKTKAEGGMDAFIDDDTTQTIIWLNRCLEQLPKTIALARSKGIAIGTGTDGVFLEQPWAVLPEEMEWMTRYGIPNMDVIVSATQVGARALGKAGEFGTVEKGKLADLIMVDRDPLQDITTFKEVNWVMKEGFVVPRSPEWNRLPVQSGGKWIMDAVKSFPQPQSLTTDRSQPESGGQRCTI
jgi:imidazolonepropionase-like amidohydrolase